MNRSELRSPLGQAVEALDIANARAGGILITLYKAGALPQWALQQADEVILAIRRAEHDCRATHSSVLNDTGMAPTKTERDRYMERYPDRLPPPNRENG